MYKKEIMAELIRAEASQLGIDLIGFSIMKPEYCYREDWKEYIVKKNYNYVISLASAISVSSCDLLLKGIDQGSMFYFDKHTKAQAAYLDQASEKLCVFLEKYGYMAFHVPGMDTAFPKEWPKTIISHITHARLSGLGIMGDSGMILTKEYGPRVRLTSILTDCPLPVPETLPENFCTHCEMCKKICPSGSIKGASFDSSKPAEYYNDKVVCNAHRDENKANYGTRFCNLCMAVCPIGEDKKRIKDNKGSIER